jgi:hypothetical protein
MALHRPVTVRSAALRSSAFSLAKAFSIGLKSGAIGREIEQARAGRFDQRPHPWPLVAGEIVQDHDVAGPQLGDEDLLNIRLKGGSVDRAIQDKRRDQTGRAESRHDGRGFPVPMRNADPQALATRGATIAPGHVGGRPCLVDEHQTLRVKIELALEPRLAPLQDIRAVLL